MGTPRPWRRREDLNPLITALQAAPSHLGTAPLRSVAGDDFEAVGNITERQPRIKAAKRLS